MGLPIPLLQFGGVGYDQVPAVQRVVNASGADVVWEEHFAGLAAAERGLPLLSSAAIDAVRLRRLALKTKLLAPPGVSPGKLLRQFRNGLGLFASIRPICNLPGLAARFEGIDFVVLRELTEDLSAAIEHTIVPGVVQSIKVVTEAACRRFFRFAFEWASQRSRKLIHCVHKANILKLADGLVLEAFRAVALEFPQLEARDLIVDNCCMQLVTRPTRFDVLAMGNLYGDLVSDLGAGLVGGISATSGWNVGEDGLCVYETFHGGRREEIGEGMANPVPLLLPTLDLLEANGQTAPAERIRRALEAVLSAGAIRTPDLGGTNTTEEFADAIVAAM